jgi:hypothetical protein
VKITMAGTAQTIKLGVWASSWAIFDKSIIGAPNNMFKGNEMRETLLIELGFLAKGHN